MEINLSSAYQKIRKSTINFCSHLEDEDFAIQIVQFASPAKWHLAHTTWFFEAIILKNYIDNYQEFDSNFDFLFNSYYNSVGNRILQKNRGNLSRPSTDKIFEYRKYVDGYMLQLFEKNATDRLRYLVTLGLNHEQQHQELLITDVKYMLGHNPISPVFHPKYNLVGETNYTHNNIQISAGLYKIGYQGSDFCYDNELGVHKVYVDDFEINNYLVTNGEYINFIESGAYSDFNLWLDEGWSWIKNNNINAPLYWHKIDEQWHYYTLAGLKKVDENAMLAHINYYEANAFAEWSGMRLPTEFEWEIASNQLKWGSRWEWTNSAYLAYPRFKKENGAIGEYNGKFMCNKMVLRGASIATPKNHSRNTYRNFFHPSERWQFTGIRLVK